MPTPNLSKALFAGLLAGVAATAAKTIWEEHFPVRDEKRLCCLAQKPSSYLRPR